MNDIEKTIEGDFEEEKEEETNIKPKFNHFEPIKQTYL